MMRNMKFMKMIYMAVLLISIFLVGCAIGENDAPVMWKLKISKSGKDIVFPNYTIEGDRMYLTVNYLERGDVLMSEKPTVYCIDLKDGKIKWEKDFENEDVISSRYKPLIGSKFVYIPTYGSTIALNKDNGEKIWESSKVRKMNSEDRICIYDDIIYLSWKNHQGERSIGAIDGLTGEVKFGRKSKPEYDKYISERIYSKDKFYTIVEGKLTCYDRKTEEVNWSIEDKGLIFYHGQEISENWPLLTTDEYVYINNENAEIYKLKASNGKEIWRQRFKGYLINMERDDKNIFASDNYGNTYCINQKDGKIKWRYFRGWDVRSEYEEKYGIDEKGRIPKGRGYNGANQQVYRNTLYVSDQYGYFYALDKETGKLKWGYPESGPKEMYNGGLIIKDNIAYFSHYEDKSNDSNFIGLNLQSRKVVWKSKIGSSNRIYNDKFIIISPENENTWQGYRTTELNIYAISIKPR